MKIAIFNGLTTEEALLKIEEQSNDYDGLYVDMNIKKERKFVKDKASLIGDLLKKLERARIDKSKEYKVMVESEAKAIKKRLEVANKPFMELIEEHKKQRAEQLAKEKAIQDAKDLAIQIESDHGDAVTLDKMRAFEIEEEERGRKEREQTLIDNAKRDAEVEKEKALERAEEAEKQRVLIEAQAKRDAEEAEKQRVLDVKKAEEDAKAREIKRQEDKASAELEAQRKIESNKKHVGKIRKELKEHIMKVACIDECAAKKVVLSLLKTDRVTIHY